MIPKINEEDPREQTRMEERAKHHRVQIHTPHERQVRANESFLEYQGPCQTLILYGEIIRGQRIATTIEIGCWYTPRGVLSRKYEYVMGLISTYFNVKVLFWQDKACSQGTGAGCRIEASTIFHEQISVSSHLL